MNLQQVNKDELIDSLEASLNASGLRGYIDFVKNRDESMEQFKTHLREQEELLKKKADAFTQEVVEARAAFDHKLELDRIDFERAQELKKLEMEHNEKMFVADSKFTKEFIENELNNAATIHDSELEQQKAAFESELLAAKALMESEIENARTIAQAEIVKTKAEAEILYTYDATILAKKMQTEVSDKYDELLEIANKYDAAQELIARIEADKEYFKSFSEARVERSEDVTDALIGKLPTKECAPVTVNVSEVKKAKKN